MPVSGAVTFNGERPATGPDCASCPDCSKAGVSFTSVQGAVFTSEILCSASSYAFSLDLAPGTYALAVQSQGDTYTSLPPYDRAVVVRRLRMP